MKANTSTVLLNSTRLKTRGFLLESSGEESVSDRQENVPGFEQPKMRNASVGLIGAGGINGPIGLGLVRKGVGHLSIYDHDSVSPSNLSRQFFFQEDLGKPKAVCLAKNLLAHASYPTTITAYPFRLVDAVAHGHHPMADVYVCGPDNNRARVHACRYFLKTTPVVFIGVGGEAEHAYLLVQKPKQACFACVFPEAVGDKRQHCPGTPAIIDILMVAAGLALTAIDSLLMPGRRITWNFWDIYPSGMISSKPLAIRRNRDCPICGGQQVDRSNRLGAGTGGVSNGNHFEKL